MEILPKGTNGLFLSVDEDRNIIFEKSAKHIDLKKLFDKHLFKSRRKVIVAADPTLATTIPIPLELARDEGTKKKERIALPELENLIAQAMAKIFNGCRTEAAKRLGIHELDTILVGLKAKNFKVDGKAVVSPVGFAGKKITLFLEMTFTTRAIFEDLKYFFNSPEEFFFAEAPQALLSSLSRVRKPPLSLVVVNNGGTTLYVLEKPKDEYPVLYREKLGWAFGSFFRKITEELGVSEKVARDLYKKHLDGDMSEHVKKAVKKAIQPALDAFWEEIGKGKLRGFAYIDAQSAMPFALPHRHGPATFEKHPVGDILAQLGFSADPGVADGDRNATLRATLYFLEAYFDKSNSDVNQKLRRRLHWLAE